MIRIFQKTDTGEVQAADDCHAALSQGGLVWIDLVRPTEGEEQDVERALAIDVLTPSERMAFEDSARFYAEGGALYLTTTLLGRRDDGPFAADPVTFILNRQGVLITVRDIHPRAFDVGKGRSSARIEHAPDGAAIFIALIEGCVERIADLLMENTKAAHELSSEIFVVDETRMPDLRRSLHRMGRLGTLSALCHESLSSLARAVSYAAHAHDHAPLLHQEALLALRHDIEHLEHDVEAFKSHLTYLQEAMLGMVGAGQNNALKALSLATIAFVPPTLIASIFGMNFKYLSWFDAPWGPGVAFAMMVLTPALLFVIARWRHWF